jgi:hypothetical protein
MTAIATVLAAVIVAAAVVVNAVSNRYSFHYEETSGLTRMMRFDRLTGETKVCIDYTGFFDEIECVDRYFDASGRIVSYTLPR